MKWRKTNQKNWQSLTKENKKLVKRIMRDFHDEILDDIATCQRLDDIAFALREAWYIPFLNGEIIIRLDWKKR